MRRRKSAIASSWSVGTAAAIGLILYFVCAVYTHVRVGDYHLQFGLANGFLLLAAATLTLDLTAA